MAEGFSSLTLHGLPRVATSKHIALKLVWLILWIISVCLFVTVVISRSEKFKRHETIFKPSVSSYDSMAFPSITVCNVKNFASDACIDTPLGNCSGSSTHHGLVDNDALCRVNSYPCGRRSITTHSSTNSCITVNPDRKLVQYFPSSQGGLELVLAVNEDSDDEPVETSIGIALFVHAPSISPFTNHPYFLLSPGTMSLITIKKFNIKRLRSPYASDCTSQGAKTPYYFPGDYTVNGCRIGCIADSMMKYCNGRINKQLTRYMRDDARIKNNGVEDANCSYSTYYGKEPCRCQLRCASELYESEISSSIWPRKSRDIEKCRAYLRSGTKCDNVSQVSDDFIKGNFLRLVITYSEFSTTTKEEVAIYDRESFASDVGGIMGLFLGASLISWGELVVVVLTKIGHWLWSRGRNFDNGSMQAREREETKSQTNNAVIQS